MKSVHPNIASRGFTLIEILVGLVISTLILGAAASVFVTGTRSWEKGNKAYKTLQTARTLGDIIERYLRSAVPPTNDGTVVFWGEDFTMGSAYGHRMTFLTSASGRFPRDSARTDVSELEFFFDPSDETGFSMRIDATPDEFPDEGGYRIPLSTLVRSFQVTYFDGANWTEEWYENALPVAIEFHILINDPDEPPPGPDEDPEMHPPAYEISRLVTLPMAKPIYNPGSTNEPRTRESAPQ